MRTLDYGRRAARFGKTKYFVAFGVGLFIIVATLIKTFMPRVNAYLATRSQWNACVSYEIPGGVAAYTDDPAIGQAMRGRRDVAEYRTKSWRFSQYIGDPQLGHVRSDMGIVYLGPAVDDRGARGVLLLLCGQYDGDFPEERVLYMYGAWFRKPEDVKGQRRALLLRVFSVAEDRTTVYCGRQSSPSTITIPMRVNEKQLLIAASVTGDEVQLAIDGASAPDSNGTRDWHTDADLRLRNIAGEQKGHVQ